MPELLREVLRSLREILRDLLPIIVVIGFFQLVVLQRPIPYLENILVGAFVEPGRDFLPRPGRWSSGRGQSWGLQASAKGRRFASGGMCWIARSSTPTAEVVRVNDVQLELSNSDLYLRRVEVGLAGAVRRLVAGILAPRLVRHLAGGLSERGIPWDYVGLVEPQSAQIRLKVHQQLARLHPADIADIIEDLGRVDRKELVSLLDTETAAQALSEVEPPVQATVVEDMQVDKAADLLEEMQPDEAADILGDLSEERSKALLEAMEKDDAEEVGELLNFDEDTAGGLMKTEFFRADRGWSVGQTCAALREADPDLLGEMDEIPLTDPGGRLVGIVPSACRSRSSNWSSRSSARAARPASARKAPVWACR